MARLTPAERIAPWCLMALLAGGWWGGARLVRWSGLSEQVPSVAAASERTVADVAPANRDAPPAVGRVRQEGRDEGAVTFDDIADLRDRKLTIPVRGVEASALSSTYRDKRDTTRTHEAMDIAAPRGTPVVAVEDGTVAKLFTSKQGGLTVYQFDPSGRFAYYYAHLDRYATDLADQGAPVKRGQILGYVGTTGNAPPDAPHLHFAIFKLTADRRWWQGTPLDPFLVLR